MPDYNYNPFIRQSSLPVLQLVTRQMQQTDLSAATGKNESGGF